MARLLIFHNIPKGDHTWYEDAETGALVTVYPGTQVPVRKIVNPEQYVARGLARLEGSEDGTDGRLDRLMAGLRSLIGDLAPLPGPQRAWTLEAMLAQAEQIQADDAASRAEFEAAAAAALTREEIQAADEAAQPAKDEAGGGTPGVASDEPKG